ncbi:MAG: radical SAM protein [Chitinivibrionales bacterium]
MKICEKFLSIQGESYRTGELCYFIRCSGCNLRCSYCDTEYAYEEGVEFTPDQMVRAAAESGTSLVEITGGEPLLQSDLTELCTKLLKQGLEVMIETNGSQDISCVPEGVIKVMDIKCPGSMEKDSFLESNISFMSCKDEYKFVISDIEDYMWAKAYYKSRLKGIGSRTSFSPEIGRLKPGDLWEWIVRDRLDVRFGLQIHKLVFSNDVKGV